MALWSSDIHVSHGMMTMDDILFDSMLATQYVGTHNYEKAALVAA